MSLLVSRFVLTSQSRLALRPAKAGLRTARLAALLIGASAAGCASTDSAESASQERQANHHAAQDELSDIDTAIPVRRAKQSLIVTVQAEWADIDPAVRFAAREHELAIERVDKPAPGRRDYQLLSMRDEPAWIRVRADRPPAGELDQSLRSVRLEIRWGLFGDGQRERALLATLRDRLEHLREQD